MATTRVENVFAVHWGVPEQADADRILAEVAALAGAHESLCYAAVMPESLPRLDEVQGKLLMALTEALLERCEAVCVVVEARGFRGAILRSMLTAVNFVTGKHDRVRFVDDDEQAIHFLPSKGTCDADVVMQALREVRELEPS